MSKIKWFIFIYALFLIVYISTSKFTFKESFLELILLIIIGSFLLFIFSKRDLPIHKMELITIIFFGLLCVFFTPIISAPDEYEHFTRAELTSKGEFFPKYVDHPANIITHKDFVTIKSVGVLANKNQEKMKFKSKFVMKYVNDTRWDDLKIDYTPYYVNAAFNQNPFYGYIPQAIGIDIAKGLNLTNIWMIWIGRICNLIFYGLLCAYAIKKAPIYKNALFVAACLPLSIFLAASLSIDPIINALSFLTIAYFLYMYKQADNSLTWKNILIFTVISLLCAFTKVSLLALSLLIFLIPKSKFKNQKTNIGRIFGFLITFSCTAIWLKLYALNGLIQSPRYNFNLNTHYQLLFIKSHFTSYLITITKPSLYYSLIFIKVGFFRYVPRVFVILFIIFFVLYCLNYPQKEKLKNFSRIGLFIISVILVLGTVTILYLTNNKIGANNVSGVQFRYFIPIIPLMPMIFNITKNNITTNKTKLLFYTINLAFIAEVIMAIILRFFYH